MIGFALLISQFSAGTVAQSVEQRTENPRVGGSIPSRPTTTPPFRPLFQYPGFHFYGTKLNEPVTNQD